MLELRDIYKDYPVGDDIVRALKGISVTFRDSEFVVDSRPVGLRQDHPAQHPGRP